MTSHLQPSPIDFVGVEGSHSGLMLGGFGRVDELNDRIHQRVQSDHSLPVQYDPRAVPTKYSIFPIFDRRAKPESKPPSKPTYDVQKVFAPIGRRGPVDYFLANVDTETVLQNRHVVYQKFADQSVYVPHSNSDLYRVEAVGRQEPQTHSSLFEQRTYATTGSHVAELVGRDMFHNSTRTQLRGL
jgi:hypothetical protein